jgi:hypothetical protein
LNWREVRIDRLSWYSFEPLMSTKSRRDGRL